MGPAAMQYVLHCNTVVASESCFAKKILTKIIINRQNMGDSSPLQTYEVFKALGQIANCQNKKGYLTVTAVKLQSIALHQPYNIPIENVSRQCVLPCFFPNLSAKDMDLM